jgi:hypothetical protein
MGQVEPIVDQSGNGQIRQLNQPVNTHDTTKTGTVCHRSGILATVPVPVKPVGWLPQVYLYPCYTLVEKDIAYANIGM